MTTYHILGLMSGSSLDGLDVAHCKFVLNGTTKAREIVEWEILCAGTVEFSDSWKERLVSIPSGSAISLVRAHAEFGHYMGELVLQFLQENNIPWESIDLLGSHGHTVFHEPSLHFTTQIGDGAALAAVTGITTVCDFRSTDIALGGQGAPLAPLADRMLLKGHDFYLNIGGIANITAAISGKHVAFDTSGANQMLNALASLLGLKYDDNGQIATTGKMNQELFNELNSPSFFKEFYPKSLSNQWVQQNAVRQCLEAKGEISDKLHTACHHIAYQIGKSIGQIINKEKFEKESYSMLATGGGALNGFLMECISHYNPSVKIVKPTSEIIKFKEALLIALLGILRIENIPNCISTVTGASKDAIGGAIYSA